MSQYTSAEYANMHFIYGFCNGNANRAAALYQERYPNIRHPDYRVFIQVHNLLCEGRLRGTGLSGASEGRPQRHSVCQSKEDPNFFEKILWTDELTCRRDEFLNMHNLHSWQLEKNRD
ncbi:unnamed protein product [Euphydryas editha]|uniref:DUF4817 domain-containing protein n=1 Tax=Euphydryas editha TaxID=104508 RepID=A0AAU9TS74_EUPED|nr:unnamed protein product [Euphydryas editha]